jgi:L-iditol 2-dehydrogenase
MAVRLGADVVVDPRATDPLAPGGVLEGGADVVIEAVGHPATNRQALEWAARGGTVLWFGVTPPGQTVAVEPNLIFQKELTIRGALVNPYTHAPALALLGSGRMQVRPLITRTISLEELPAALEAGPGDDVKTVVVPR